MKLAGAREEVEEAEEEDKEEEEEDQRVRWRQLIGCNQPEGNI